MLDIAYRGDDGAPRSPDGLGHLGDSEWRDLDAAIRYAVRSGAQRVILHGWSTGATMALHAAADSALRERISGIVLDSPVLDWEFTLRALATARRTPGVLLPLAVRAAQGRTGMDGDRLRRRPSTPRPCACPTLLFHGPDDTLASWGSSRELADRRPGLITLHTVAARPARLHVERRPARATRKPCAASSPPSCDSPRRPRGHGGRGRFRGALPARRAIRGLRPVAHPRPPAAPAASERTGMADSVWAFGPSAGRLHP